MMEYRKQLRLQAYLDGELPEPEAREVAAWVAQDQTARSLLEELRQTTRSLSGFEDGVGLPETREFYWSKIRAAIEREEQSAADTVTCAPWFRWLRRLLVPMAGVALVTFFALFGIRHGGNSYPGSAVIVLEDAPAFTYRDFSGGATLVWFSYPADKRVAGEDEPTILD
jgi:negative regulator of sigma E activity